MKEDTCVGTMIKCKKFVFAPKNNDVVNFVYEMMLQGGNMSLNTCDRNRNRNQKTKCRRSKSKRARKVMKHKKEHEKKDFLREYTSNEAADVHRSIQKEQVVFGPENTEMKTVIAGSKEENGVSFREWVYAEDSLENGKLKPKVTKYRSQFESREIKSFDNSSGRIDDSEAEIKTESYSDKSLKHNDETSTTAVVSVSTPEFVKCLRGMNISGSEDHLNSPINCDNKDSESEKNNAMQTSKHNSADANFTIKLGNLINPQGIFQRLDFNGKKVNEEKRHDRGELLTHNLVLQLGQINKFDQLKRGMFPQSIQSYGSIPTDKGDKNNDDVEMPIFNSNNNHGNSNNNLGIFVNTPNLSLDLLNDDSEYMVAKDIIKHKNDNGNFWNLSAEDAEYIMREITKQKEGVYLNARDRVSANSMSTGFRKRPSQDQNGEHSSPTVSNSVTKTNKIESLPLPQSHNHNLVLSSGKRRLQPSIHRADAKTDAQSQSSDGPLKKPGTIDLSGFKSKPKH